MTKQSALIQLPKNLSAQEDAAISIVGKTALECMRELDLKSGDLLFITGASGAIGTLVLQLAKAKVVRISASASLKNHDYMKSLGAEHTVDYADADWKKQVIEWSNGGVDKALAIQPGTGIDSIQVVKDKGELITASGDNTSISPQRDIEVRQMGHQLFTNKEITQLIEEISNGTVKVEIEKEYPFTAALEALEKTETRRARGKMVVKVA